MKRGTIDLAPLITQRFPLERTATTIEVLRKGEGVKVFINSKG